MINMQCQYSGLRTFRNTLLKTSILTTANIQLDARIFSARHHTSFGFDAVHVMGLDRKVH